MKRRIFLVFIVALLFLLTVTVLAHSGRTDSNGGHWNRSTGEYHYHHGEPPHDHYDIDGDGDADCPIRYERANEQASEDEEYNWIWIIIFLIILALVLSLFWRLNDDESNIGCGCFTTWIIVALLVENFEKRPLLVLAIVVLVAFLWFLSYGVYKLYNKIDHKGRINKYQSTVDEYISYITSYKEKEAEYLEFERIPIPDDCEIKGGLPANKGVSIGYGDKFTVYQSGNGGKVHTVCGCCSVFNEKHIYNFKRYSDFDSMLCKKCSSNYIPPDMSWYENYLQYTHLLREIFDLYDKRAELKEEVVQQRKSCNKFSIKLILMFDRQSRKCLKDADKLVRSLQIIQEYRDKQDTKI